MLSRQFHNSAKVAKTRAKTLSSQGSPDKLESQTLDSIIQFNGLNTCAINLIVNLLVCNKPPVYFNNIKRNNIITENCVFMSVSMHLSVPRTPPKRWTVATWNLHTSFSDILWSTAIFSNSNIHVFQLSPFPKTQTSLKIERKLPRTRNIEPPRIYIILLQAFRM